MPEMDGPTLATQLRARNPNLKIIFVSGYAEDAFEKNLPDDVQFNFLAKPFTLKQLVAAVKDTMAARLAERLADAAPLMRTGSGIMPYDASGQCQHQHDHQHDAEDAGGAIAPAAAVRPARNGADEKQNQDDQQDCAEHVRLMDCDCARCAGRHENAGGNIGSARPIAAGPRGTGVTAPTNGWPFELLLEAVEHLVHLRPALELLHVVEPARDVRIGRHVAADQLAERHEAGAEIVRDRDRVAGEILVVRPDVVVVEHLQPALRLLLAPLDRRLACASSLRRFMCGKSCG